MKQFMDDITIKQPYPITLIKEEHGYDTGSVDSHGEMVVVARNAYQIDEYSVIFKEVWFESDGKYEDMNEESMFHECQSMLYDSFIEESEDESWIDASGQ